MTVEVLDRSVSSLFELLGQFGAGRDDGVSVTTSEPTAMVSCSASHGLANDPSTGAVEGVESTLEREATMTANKLTAMAASGAIAVAGIMTNTVHLVIGAMVIAPAFEPFLKLALRVTGPTRSFRRGLHDVSSGWIALVAGAAAAAVVLDWLGVPLDGSTGGYLGEGSLLGYWREVTVTGTAVALVAGMAGAVLIIANRAVLTAGVMVALGLVPGAALVGLAVVEGDGALALDGARRWTHDALIVTGLGAVVFASLHAVRGRASGEPAAPTSRTPAP